MRNRARYVPVLPQQLAVADILAQRRSLFPRKREGGRRCDIVSGFFVSGSCAFGCVRSQLKVSLLVRS